MINRLVAVLSIGYSIFLFSTGDSTSALAKSAALILFGAAVLISELPLPKFNFKRTRKEPEEMTVEKWQTEEEEDVTFTLDTSNLLGLINIPRINDIIPKLKEISKHQILTNNINLIKRLFEENSICSNNIKEDSNLITLYNY